MEGSSFLWYNEANYNTLENIIYKYQGLKLSRQISVDLNYIQSC